MHLNFSSICNMTGTSIVSSGDSTDRTESVENKPLFKFKGHRPKFSKPEPYLRNMFNAAVDQYEKWTMAFGEPEIVKKGHTDSYYILSKTWQTDRGPVTVEELVNKKNGNVEDKAYNIGLEDGSTARYDSNGNLRCVFEPNGSILYYDHEDGTFSDEF